MAIQTNDELIDEFLNAKKLEGCQDSTINLYAYRLDLVKDFLEKDNISFINCTTKDLQNYLIDYKETKKVSNVTLNNARDIINSFYQYLIASRYIEFNPTLAIKKIKEEKVIKPSFTDEELERLRKACKKVRNRAIIEVLYSTGIRVGELCDIKMNDVDLEKQRIVINRGKGAKMRMVSFSDMTLYYMKEYLKVRKGGDTTDFFFTTLRLPYTGLTPSGIQCMLRRLGNSAGLEDVHPHKFRHTCATLLQKRGMPIEEISKFLGHDQIATTMEYINIDYSQIDADYRRYY